VSVTFRYRHTWHAPVVFATHAAGVPREITHYAHAHRNKTRRMTRPVIACYPLHQRVGMCVAVCAGVRTRTGMHASMHTRCAYARICAEECVLPVSRAPCSTSQDMRHKVERLRRRLPCFSVLLYASLHVFQM